MIADRTDAPRTSDQRGITLLTKKQLAARLNVTPRTIENYCQRGIIPFVVIPAGKRFDPADVEHFINGRKFCHRG